MYSGLPFDFTSDPGLTYLLFSRVILGSCTYCSVFSNGPRVWRPGVNVVFPVLFYFPEREMGG